MRCGGRSLAAATLCVLLALAAWPRAVEVSPALAGALPHSVFHHTARARHVLLQRASCWRTSHPDAMLGSEAVVWRASPEFSGTRWGNALGVYWQARGVALLAGLAFDARGGGGFARTAGWLSELPDHAALSASDSNPALLARSCRACAALNQYPHECTRPVFAERTAVAIARRQSHAAMQRWRRSDRAAAAADGASPIQRHGEHRVAVHVRCCNPRVDPGRCALGMGWLPWTFYRTALASLRRPPTHVTLVAGRQCRDAQRARCAVRDTIGAPNCTELLDLLAAQLEGERGALLAPRCAIERSAFTTISDDWFALVDADTLIAGVSTFSLWAAILHRGSTAVMEGAQRARGALPTSRAPPLTAALSLPPLAIVPNITMFFGAATPHLHDALQWIDVPSGVVTTRDTFLCASEACYEYTVAA